MHHGFCLAAATPASARRCVLEPFLAHTRDGGLRSYRINSNDQPCGEVRSTQGSAANDGCLVLGDAHRSSRINAALDGRIAIAIDARLAMSFLFLDRRLSMQTCIVLG